MEKKLLEGRVAVVAGSGQGVGRALALGLAAQGARVVTNNSAAGGRYSDMITPEQYNALSPERKEWFDREKELHRGDAMDTAERIRQAGGEAAGCYADITKDEDAARLIDTAVATFGGIDILCNVAGGFGFSDIDEISDELWDHVNNVKPRGYFHTMKHAIPYMKKQGYGRIINTTSVAWMGDIIKHAEYCAANAGVVGLTRAAAKELWRYGISCNAFSPFAKTRASYELDAISLVRENPISIFGKMEPFYETTPIPEDFVPFLVWLASEQAGHVSGSVFSLAGKKIQLHSEPVVEKTLFKAGDEPWTVEEIADLAPEALFKDYKSIADLDKEGW